MGLISRYFTETTRDLPAHACSRHVPCDQLGCCLFGYGIQSHLHLMNLMVFKSQSPNVSAGCHDAFVDSNQKSEHNSDSRICQTHPFFGGSRRRSGNLGIRKGEPPVERQRVKGILGPSQHASVHSQEVQFQVLTLHSNVLPRLWSHRNVALKVCEINI